MAVYLKDLTFPRKELPSSVGSIFQNIFIDVLQGNTASLQKKSFNEIIEAIKQESIYRNDAGTQQHQEDEEGKIELRDHWRKEVTIPNTSKMVCTLNLGKYQSTCLSEKAVGQENSLYYYFFFFEERDVNCTFPFLKIRVDLSGEKGEVLFLGSYSQFTGNLLKGVCDRFFEYIGLDECFKNDQACIKLKSRKGQLEIYLRELTSIASVDGKTWYEKSGYSIYECNLVKTHDNQFHTQSSRLFYTAVEKVRNTTLVELEHISQEGEKLGVYNSNSLDKLYEKYLPLLFTVKRVDSLSQLTVHDLGKVIVEAGKSKKVFDADLYNFQTIALTSYNPNVEVERTFSLYNLAVKIILKHHIWHKTFRPKQEVLNYTTYIGNPRVSFDEWMKSENQLSWIALQTKLGSVKRKNEFDDERQSKKPRIDEQ